MRMLVTVEFIDASVHTGPHPLVVVGREPNQASPGDIGLTLEEAKHLLNCVQCEFVVAQAEGLVERSRTCARCGRNLPMKDVERRRIHTLFGRIALSATRLKSCTCDGSKPRAIWPLKGWLTRCSNELRYQAARLGSDHSYRKAAALLQELLPVHPLYGHVRVREAVLSVGARLEQEADLPLIKEYRPLDSEEPFASIAFDGGYVRRTRKGPRRNFEVLAGALQNGHKIKVFATVYPNRATLPERLRRFAATAGLDELKHVDVMTDGAHSLLRLRGLLRFKTRFVLDYFHVAMKLRHMDQCIGRIPPMRLWPEGSLFEHYDRSAYLRAYIWTGRREKIEESIQTLLALLDRVAVVSPDHSPAAGMAAGHVVDLWGHLRANADGVINYQAWKRLGRRISSSGVEGTVNRLIGRRLGKDQQMCWTKRGAHLLLQVRCAMLNSELLPVFRRWCGEVGGHTLGSCWLWRPQHS